MNLIKFYIEALQNDSEKQFKLIITIVTGLISLFAAWLIFTLGKRRDKVKEKRRLAIERLNLYFAIKFWHQAIIVQLKNIKVVIDKITLNLEIENGGVEFPKIIISTDLNAYALNQINKNDISQILIHKHKDFQKERSKSNHFLLENILLAKKNIKAFNKTSKKCFRRNSKRK